MAETLLGKEKKKNMKQSDTAITDWIKFNNGPSLDSCHEDGAQHFHDKRQQMRKQTLQEEKSVRRR